MDSGSESTPGAGRTGSPTRLLESLARRVRDRRRALGWSRSSLASRSGLSVRFLARVEGGEGNISVLRLEELARALGTTSDQLLLPLDGVKPIVALVGLRGAGKSTVGPLLARRLGRPFVEMDDLITEASGLSLEQLFELHGEIYYRQLESETVSHVLSQGGPMVLAAAGGIVNEEDSWERLCSQASVVWLRASPADHWSRVVAQGDRRPMADNPRAMEELRALLRDRDPAYRRARITVDTTGRSPEEVAQTIANLLEAPAASG